ncbi:chromate transporter [Peribacillus alkalitolerans]|uniref:chromate transporter n=1 Tax=Peribacillus alkalitolerans TaxID=1550385 RepID=UPI0013D7B08C|nr:chromate transporter [Peribacillus alkalitolerans]
MERDWKQIHKIFWSFFKIAPLTFGGGYAMIPLIEKEIVHKNKWLVLEDVSDIFALAQSVPGAIVINSAAFIGQRIAGIRGAIAAILGVSLPTFFIVLTLGYIFRFLEENPKLEGTFLSIRVSIIALIVYAAITVGKTAIIDRFTFFLSFISVPILFFIHPILAILIGSFIGILKFIKQVKTENKSKLKSQKENKFV